MANITVTKSLIGARDISWGTGTFTRIKSDGTYGNLNQVNAASIPIADAGAHYANDRVEYALGYAGTRITQIAATNISQSASIGTLTASVSTGQSSQSATINSIVKYWWRNPGDLIKNTTNTRVVLPAGYYPVGGKVYYTANTIGWSFQQNSQTTKNRGLDFAGNSSGGWRKANKWYYLYATTYGNSLAFVASGSIPTGKYDTTTLSGAAYDTNTYVCAFKTRSNSNLCWFQQNGQMNLGAHLDADGSGTYMLKTIYSATSANWLGAIVACPPKGIAESVLLNLGVKGKNTGTPCEVSFGESGLFQTVMVSGHSTASTMTQMQWTKLIQPLRHISSTINLFYYRPFYTHCHASVIMQCVGYYDRFC